MDRRSIILVALAPAMGEAHTPVQIQKALFLIDKEIPALVGGPFFNFRPYDYGPFDKEVYSSLEALIRDGLVEVEGAPGVSVRHYRLTEAGQRDGQSMLAYLERREPRASSYIKDVSSFVRSLSFDQLVAAIYKAYPDQKANSVFRR